MTEQETDMIPLVPLPEPPTRPTEPVAQWPLQTIFDVVADHLLRQARPAVDVNGMCCYRLHRLKCAIGCLIPDAEYTRDLEGTIFNGRVRILDILGFNPNDLPVEHQPAELHGGMHSTVPISPMNYAADAYTHIPPRMRLLGRLQVMHDDLARGSREWPTRLEQIAAEFDIRAYPR
jgi:hypothetical protein